jgi:PKD repeat protein
MDNNGDISVKDGISINVSDNLLPNADFTTNTTEIFPGQWIQFTDLTTGGNTPLNYQWNFGDGSPISTEQNPSHLFSSPGVFTITLTVTDSNGDVDVVVKENFITVEAGENVITGYHFLWTLFFIGMAFFVLYLRRFSTRCFRMKK